MKQVKIFDEDDKFIDGYLITDEEYERFQRWVNKIREWSLEGSKVYETQDVKKILGDIKSETV